MKSHALSAGKSTTEFINFESNECGGEIAETTSKKPLHKKRKSNSLFRSPSFCQNDNRVEGEHTLTQEKPLRALNKKKHEH
jgi:hypothetical protein